MAKETIERRPPLTDRQKEIMLTVLLRSRAAFETVREQLQTSHFNEYEQGYALLWRVAVEHYNQFSELPDETYVLSAIESALDENPDLLVDAEIEKLDQFIQAAYSVPIKQLRAQVGIRFVQQFLMDKLASLVASEFSGERYAPANLVSVFDDYRNKVAEIDSLQGLPTQVPFSEDWRPTVPPKRSTGMEFVDRYLNGGHCAGEVYGFLAPYGTCKTTIMVQMSILAAGRSYRQWAHAGCVGPMPVSYPCFYEEPVDPAILLRAVSYAAQIPRDKLEDTANWDKLSTSDKLEPYEKKLFAKLLAAGQRVRGERERLVAYQKILNRNWRPLDMTGADINNPGRGSGMVAEVAAIIRNDIRTQNVTPVFIGLDYATAMAEAHVSASGADHSEFRHLIGRMPLRAKRELALQFQCPVWILHQLSGAANARGSGVLQHHSDAAEAKNFAENCDFAFTVGSKTMDSMALLRCTKARRAAIAAESVIFIDGAFSRVLGADNHTYDMTSRRIVSRSELSHVADAFEVGKLTLPKAANTMVASLGRK